MRPRQRPTDLDRLVGRVGGDAERRAPVERDRVAGDAAAVFADAVERHLHPPADERRVEAWRTGSGGVGPAEAEARTIARRLQHGERERTCIDEPLPAPELRAVTAVRVAEQEIRDPAAAEVLQVGARADADDHAG